MGSELYLRNTLIIAGPGDARMITVGCGQYSINEWGVRVLDCLDRHPGVSVERLSELLGLTSPETWGTLAAFVVSLEAEGIVVRDRGSRGRLVLKRQTCAPALDRIFCEVTAACNLNCIHCYADAGPVRCAELTIDEICDLVDQCDRFGVWQFDITGGEPFMRHDMADLLSHLDRRHMIHNIFTNASLLDDAAIERC